MSCYLIKVENGHKVARSITSEEEYKQLRGSNEQKANLRLARAGNDAAKRRLGIRAPQGWLQPHLRHPRREGSASCEGRVFSMSSQVRF